MFFLLSNPVLSGVDEAWQSVILGDEKIGYRSVVSKAEGGKLITTETLVLHTRVPGQAVKKSATTLSYVETDSGKPLEIRKTVISEHASHSMRALVKGDLLVVSEENTRRTKQAYRLPKDFSLREGVRKKLLARANQSVIEYSFWSFSRLAFEKVRLEILAAEAGSGFQWKMVRTKPEQKNSGKAVLYTDGDYRILRESSQTSGEAFVIETCDQQCAKADVTPLQNVYRQLIKSPYRITDTALRGKIRYELEGNVTLQIPATFEQAVVPTEKGVRIEVCSRCGTEGLPSKKVLESALGSSYWLDFHDTAIERKAASLLSGKELSAEKKMKRLTRFVTQHMKGGEIIYSGYATALQALATKSGDCTEQALLLAALGRAAGVPTRVAVGLTYSNERFYGKSYVFVPHAWVQAWVGDRWMSFDSGMEGFTSGHLVLGLSSGEQAEFLKITQQLHGLKIVSAAQLKLRQ
ncbi:transglutaminase-like domain-containing protein [Teredinibacter haidensis]|uniref:transglutaminase-like domain-containing protein n=1 Tax=Teredinibacter haidensis TaxID=2731755 RepID=UPI00158809A3|nr:transglutaminase-like domain-containing protein [Teredinibacter haidensis]